jgi:acyl-CoA synthetase (NDP forming)
MSLEALIAPKSIAIIGASPNPSIGLSVIKSLQTLGFDGPVLPINPKYSEVAGETCFASLDDLPETPDVVAFCLNNAGVLAGFRQLADRGIRAAVIYGGGFAEKDEDGARMQAEIVGLAREGGISLCGPNCMGVLNPVARSATFMQRVFHADGLAGNVGFVSQSGSIAIGMLTDIRRFGYSTFISSGNEAVVTTADFIDYLVDDPNTKVIATFTESIRDPEKFVAALDRAADRGKPVVVLKVGRSERTRQAITSHTGGLAGESGVFSEVLRAHRAIEVADMDEMAEVLAVCQGKRWPKNDRIGVVTVSGGQAELILDVASSAGLDLPPLPADLNRSLGELLGGITGDGNPMDAWGNGDYAKNIPGALNALSTSDAYDAVVFCSDHLDGQPLGAEDRAFVYGQMLADACEASDKPHYYMNMRSGLMNRAQARFLLDKGIASIGSSRFGLGAISRLAHWSAGSVPRARAGHRAPASPLDGNGARRTTINEFDAKRMLAGYGVRVTREILATSLDQAVQAAREIGYPVVLKGVSDDIPHKSEYGLVKVGIADDKAVRDAWAELQQAVGRLDGGKKIDGFLVQEMISGDIEVFAGVTRDPEFGHFLAFGMGGVAVELLKDFQLRKIPLARGDAAAMISSIRAAPLFDAYRGQPAADVDSIAACLEALSDFVEDNAAWIKEIDLNPIKVQPAGRGCVLVDALIIPSDTLERTNG